MMRSTAGPTPTDAPVGSEQELGAWRGATGAGAAGAGAVGWVGAGRMGTAMVHRLLGAGYQVTVFNRTPAKLEPLVSAGAKAAPTLADLAGTGIVFVCVSSSDDLVAVTTSDEGLVALAPPPEVIVDVSTVSEEASALVRARAAERGVQFLAAPASGNPGAVASGSATFAVSGPREAYDRAAPVLAAIGRGASYCGEGEGARLVKLCHNLFLGAVAQSLVEVALLAEKGGVEREALLQFINDSVMGSAFTSYKTPALVGLDFRPTFTSKLLRKDLQLGLEAARRLEVPMPLTALVGQIVATLVGAGYGDEDFAALIEMQAGAAGVELRRPVRPSAPA